MTLARRSAVPVTLDLKLGSRPAEHLEAAAYYIASEALANAGKHAQASVVELRVDGRDGGLTLWVRDDGIGGANPRRGSGITGLKDRVAARHLVHPRQARREGPGGDRPGGALRHGVSP